jgi:opacity protein-like surface antigen
MNQKSNLKILLLAAAALSLAATAPAQSTGASPPAPAAAANPGTGTGLLGQTYTSLGYGYTDLTGTTVHQQGLRFEYNQPLNTGFDLKLGYSGARTSEFLGTQRNSQQSVDAAAVAFIPETNWGRPYLEVGAGWIWTKNAGVRDNSFLYHLETGVEYQVTTDLSLTPWVAYIDAPSIPVNNRWNYGIKTNYWLTQSWGVGVSLGRDNKRDMTYGAGVNFRF